MQCHQTAGRGWYQRGGHPARSQGRADTSRRQGRVFELRHQPPHTTETIKHGQLGGPAANLADEQRFNNVMQRFSTTCLSYPKHLVDGGKGILGAESHGGLQPGKPSCLARGGGGQQLH